MNEQFAALVFPFLAAMPRLAAIFTLLPFFGRRTTQGIVRAEFIIAMALFVYPAAIPTPGMFEAGLAPYIVLAFKEVIVGLIIGFFLGTIFWVAENVGYLIDLQTGTQNALIFDPIHDHEEGPTASFMLHLVIALVLAGGGLLILLEIIFESYLVWPIFQLTPNLDAAVTDALAARADTLFATTVRFAAPIIVLLLLIEISLGLLNRMADSIDVYSLAMPIKSMTAFFVLLVFLSFIYDAIGNFLSEDNEVLKILGEMVG